jgi:hypothetical protein
MVGTNKENSPLVPTGKTVGQKQENIVRQKDSNENCLTVAAKQACFKPSTEKNCATQ